MKKGIIFIGVVTQSLLFPYLEARSPHRPRDPLAPEISVYCDSNPKKIYRLQNSHLQEGPYFHLFDKKHIQQNLLPDDTITFRHNDGSILGSELKKLIATLWHEVQEGKKTFTHFTSLKQRDFNKRYKTGLIIAKFKKYPFVVKLFIENPESFTDPFAKGFEPMCFFMMGGGVNRHLNGFTRIKNLSYLQEKIEKNPYWRTRVTFPRKWFWLPTQQQFLHITGKNLGSKPLQHTSIPCVYAIIADYINIERSFSLKNQDDRTMAMRLTAYLEQYADPHINNYVVEKETQKIALVDTEHFLTMVGYKKAPRCDNYTQWYFHLASKMLRDTMGRNKRERRREQFKAYDHYKFVCSHKQKKKK